MILIASQTGFAQGELITGSAVVVTGSNFSYNHQRKAANIVTFFAGMEDIFTLYFQDAVIEGKSRRKKKMGGGWGVRDGRGEEEEKS